MVDVNSKRCTHENCRKQPTYGWKGTKTALFCSRHNKEGMIDLKQVARKKRRELKKTQHNDKKVKEMEHTTMGIIVGKKPDPKAKAPGDSSSVLTGGGSSAATVVLQREVITAGVRKRSMEGERISTHKPPKEPRIDSDNVSRNGGEAVDSACREKLSDSSPPLSPTEILNTDGGLGEAACTWKPIGGEHVEEGTGGEYQDQNQNQDQNEETSVDVEDEEEINVGEEDEGRPAIDHQDKPPPSPSENSIFTDSDVDPVRAGKVRGRVANGGRDQHQGQDQDKDRQCPAGNGRKHAAISIGARASELSNMTSSAGVTAGDKQSNWLDGVVRTSSDTMVGGGGGSTSTMVVAAEQESRCLGGARNNKNNGQPKTCAFLWRLK